MSSGRTRHHFRESHYSLSLAWHRVSASFLLFQCLSFHQLCICLIRTHHSPHLHPTVSHCHFCHLEPCTLYWKWHPEPLCLPLSVYVLLCSQRWTGVSRLIQGVMSMATLVGPRVGMRSSEPMKPIALHCEFSEEGPSALFLLGWIQQEAESGWLKPSSHHVESEKV